MIERYRGDTYTMKWNLDVDGTPIVWTAGDVIRFTYFKGQTETFMETTMAGGEPDGEVIFTPTATTFDTAGSFIYDVQVTFASGVIQTFSKDKLKIIDDVAK